MLYIIKKFYLENQLLKMFVGIIVTVETEASAHAILVMYSIPDLLTHL